MFKVTYLVLVVFFLLTQVSTEISHGQTVVGEPLDWIAASSEVIIYFDDVVALKNAIEDFPVYESGHLQRARHFLCEIDPPLIEYDQLVAYHESITATMDYYQPKEAILGLSRSRTGVDWVLVSRIDIDQSEQPSAPIQLLLDTLFNSLEGAVRTNQIAYEIVDQHLVLGSNQVLVTTTSEQMQNPNTDFKSMKSSRRIQATFNQLVEFTENRKRVTLFFDPKILSALIPDQDSLISQYFLKLLEDNDLLMAGLQVCLFDSDKPTERSPLLGVSGFLRVAIPRRGIFKAIEKPIDNVLPIPKNSIAAIIGRVDLPLVLDEVSRYMSQVSEVDLLSQGLGTMGFPADMATSIRPKLKGTFYIQMCPSIETGEWFTIRALQANDEREASEIVDLATQRWPSAATKQVELAGFPATIYRDMMARMHVEDWYFQSIKNGLSEFLDALDPRNNQRREFTEFIEIVRSKFKHQSDPFLVVDFSPHFWRRWRSQMSDLHLQMIERGPVTARQRINFAQTAIEMAIWEVVGNQVLIASSEEYGVHFSGILFHPSEDNEMRFPDSSRPSR